MEFLMQFYVFIIGIIFGSFFNVCIYRIPENKSIVNPPSTCTRCNTRLKSIDLIPIISYLISDKKCRYCKKEISPRYATVELLTGILFLLVYNVYSISPQTVFLLITLLVHILDLSFVHSIYIYLLIMTNLVLVLGLMVLV